jgi:hypothetical protein
MKAAIKAIPGYGLRPGQQPEMKTALWKARSRSGQLNDRPAPRRRCGACKKAGPAAQSQKHNPLTRLPANSAIEGALARVS